MLIVPITFSVSAYTWIFDNLAFLQTLTWAPVGLKEFSKSLKFFAEVHVCEHTCIGGGREREGEVGPYQEQRDQTSRRQKLLPKVSYNRRQ